MYTSTIIFKQWWIEVATFLDCFMIHSLLANHCNNIHKACINLKNIELEKSNLIPVLLNFLEIYPSQKASPIYIEDSSFQRTIVCG